MANNRLSMRKITEVLRLYFEHSRSKREIARIIGVSPTTVTDYLSRAKLAGLSYPLPADMDEVALERRLFPPNEPSVVQRPAPDWAQVHAGLRRKGVTLDLLWQEYKAEQTDGFQYSAFCAVDASDAHAGREAVHRLRRADSRDQRNAQW